MSSRNEANNPLSYIEQEARLYRFDSPDFEHRCSGLLGIPLSTCDRRKLIFYCNYLIHKSFKSETYDKLKENTRLASEFLDKNYEAVNSCNSKILGWDDFRNEFDRLEVEALPFIGYGSLINQIDARRTLRDERDAEAIIGFGGKRVFKISTKGLMNLRGLPTVGHENEEAVVALDPIFDPNHTFNGMVFDVKRNEVDALQKRESVYQIKKVPYIKVDHLMSGQLAVESAYALVYPQNDGLLLKPHLNYLFLILEGHIEMDATRFFVETTYLSDGKTTIAQWLEQEARRYL